MDVTMAVGDLGSSIKEVSESSDRKFSSRSKGSIYDPLNVDNNATGHVGSSSSSVAQQSLGDNLNSVSKADTGSEGRSQIRQEVVSSSTSDNLENTSLGIHASDSAFVPSVTEFSLSPQSGTEIAQEAAPVSPGFFTLDSQRNRSNGGVLHVDVVTISSSALFSSSGEVSNNEARRNSRRLFWDAFSRRGSRRHNDSRTIVFSSEDPDDLGSHDRWLLDFSGDLFEDGIGSDSGILGSRSRGTHEGRWHSRSEIWDRFRGGLDESSRRPRYCASGQHPDGTCSCESVLMGGESSTRGSISRIVMLAEALFEITKKLSYMWIDLKQPPYPSLLHPLSFTLPHPPLPPETPCPYLSPSTSRAWYSSDSSRPRSHLRISSPPQVLDEIHRQPLSLSLSMVSVPAPESVVNSFPLKIHKKHNAAESIDQDVEQ
ncbi:hypothetical protein IFM89_019204 [Coptis chinensis]|uniref:Uncharacterized protein n=1 Tax=Coptis chinensis TaxID=261450 RepID=A0A835IBN0_9MAGN|nr:hypothetical protein IFM89_019204 [Coptis chinensis]